MHSWKYEDNPSNAEAIFIQSTRVLVWECSARAIKRIPTWQGLPLSCWWLIWSIQNDAKKFKIWLKPWPTGTHMRVLSEIPMNTNKTGFRWFSKIFGSSCFEQKVASALEGLRCCVLFLWMKVALALEIPALQIFSRSSISWQYYVFP